MIQKDFRILLNVADVNDPDNHDGVVTYLEPDILECEIKWALESITMNTIGGGDGIPVGQVQILKVDAMQVLNSICQQIWKIQQLSQNRNRSFFLFQSLRMATPKNV